MSIVYFSEDFEKILDRIDYDALGERVAIKVHFGEAGCTTYLNPMYSRKLYERIADSTGNGTRHRSASLVECNVLYKGARTCRKDHINTARQHGFDKPIDILDGERGEESIEVNGCRLGKGIGKYDSLVVLSHFKGHIMAGFGAAIKNVGMGLGSRAGKLYMHSGLKPSINAEKCTGCRECEKHCSANAIAVVNGKAGINAKLCMGCAICIEACRFGACNVPWHGGSPKRLQEKQADYAKAALGIFDKHKPVYITALLNITKDCDCFGVQQKPIMKDVGFLLSSDIVAIDKAALDLADSHSGGSFSRINPIDKSAQINYAEKIGLGNSRYELIELDRHSENKH